MTLRLWAAGGALLLCGCARIVVLHDPLTAAEHNDLGVAYEAAGRPGLAERAYRRALGKDRRHARAWVNLGNVQASRGRLRAAERCFRSALRWSPDDGDALNNLAWSLARRGRRLAEAEALARRALELAERGAAPGRDSLYRATLAEVRRARRERPGRAPEP
jgi:Flp pilus assembly protein TadD